MGTPERSRVPSHGRKRLLLPLVAVAALVVLASGCVINGTWTAVAVPNLTSGWGQVSDVSCLAPDWCLATGADEDGQWVQRWDGSGWTDVAAPVGDEVWHIDCGTTDACAAQVPRYSSGPRDTENLVLWDGSTWRDVPPGTSTIHGPVAFACSSDGSCVFFHGAEHLTTVWDGDSFSSYPYEAGGSGDPAAQAIDCQSASDCIAVGEQGQTSHWDGSSWSLLPATVDLEVWSLSCPTSAWCAAVGFDPAAQSFQAVWDGTSWTVDPVPGGIDTFLEDVSCSSIAECVAVGVESVIPNWPEESVELAWNGSNWFVAPKAPGDPAGPYGRVSCVPNWCLASGGVFHTNDGTTDPQLMATYTWTNP